MSFFFIQFLEGLASASSLFLLAAGLSLIFGVTRIVNFAHGGLYMLGAYLTISLTSYVGFWPAALMGAIGVGLLGAMIEMGLLRRLYGAPELFQLLATFALSLIIEDMATQIWGPDDILGPRAPGLEGAVNLFGSPFPRYDLFLIVIGPAVMLLLWLTMKKTRFGILVRAAASDREMLASLGVNQVLLFTLVFALGSFLAGLGGALELPRTAIGPSLGGSVVVGAFVVVAIGGLGSLPGAFFAALLVGEIQAFGLYFWPEGTMATMFVIMAIVLMTRPQGLMGRVQLEPGEAPAGLATMTPSPMMIKILFLTFAVLAILPFFGESYFTSVASEIAIMALFASSLSLVTALGGMTCFGHAAWFGVGAYAAALCHPLVGMEGAVLAGTFAAFFAGLFFALLIVRHSGVALAMLTLAIAEIIHSIAMQAYGLTGGDNGILGIWPSNWASSAENFHFMTLAIVGAALLFLWRLTVSPFGYGLRAARDHARRAEAIGVSVYRQRALAFAVGAGLAGLAGALFTYLKGGVFPDVVSISNSVDGLAMLLLGGIGAIAGPVIGAVTLIALKVGLSAHADLWRMIVGAILLFLVLIRPWGLLGRGRL